ncbi:NUDIX hydrolase [Acidiphilium iwatense]|uniref:NUDIX domain-containing protein n=1 Tax=Acidiphilium iwatense TaxID=768198 RepID=A0ABS9DUM3_9PROT|nr:NUDIX domain-containing protein [Acidiphilium iwatense]MCF3946404.1 NUDIX domain-containing protein [Acidiphilium iwatense]
MTQTIRISAALVLDPAGLTLLVRKRGTQAFMQPGGKIEPHEDPLTALIRELREELGVTVNTSSPVYIGRFSAPAANEADSIVEAELFRVGLAGAVTPAAEIAEIAWLGPATPTGLILAPLARDHVLPLHRRLGRGAPCDLHHPGHANHTTGGGLQPPRVQPPRDRTHACPVDVKSRSKNPPINPGDSRSDQ